MIISAPGANAQCCPHSGEKASQVATDSGGGQRQQEKQARHQQLVLVLSGAQHDFFAKFTQQVQAQLSRRRFPFGVPHRG